MTITISGTTGIAGVDGTSTTPAVKGTDTDTGVVFGTNTLSLATNGTTALTVDSSQNVGIGTSSPSYKLDVTGQSRATTGFAISTDGSAFTPSGLNAIPNYGIGYITSSSTITVSGFGGISFYANQTEQSRITQAGLLQFNSGYGSVATAYGCRAWVNFNGTGTVAIRASGNVSSITDNGLGDYTVNFTNAMPDANYAVSGSAGDYTGGTQNRMGIDPKIFATGSIRINVDNTSSTTDQNAVCVSVFR